MCRHRVNANYAISKSTQDFTVDYCLELPLRGPLWKYDQLELLMLIPATVIRGVFNLFLSNLSCKLYYNYFIFVSFNLVSILPCFANFIYIHKHT